MKSSKKSAKLLSFVAALGMISLGFANSVNAANVVDVTAEKEPEGVEKTVKVMLDSDINSLDVLIRAGEGKELIDIVSKLPGGRMVYSAKLGKLSNYFGPGVIDSATLKKYGVTGVKFTLDEDGKTNLKSLGYNFEGEINEFTPIDEAPGFPYIKVSGTSTVPGIKDFTGTLEYQNGGGMIMPMTIKVLPDLYLTKDLKVPEGTTAPALDYIFHFEPQDGAPALDDVKLAYNAR